MADAGAKSQEGGCRCGATRFAVTGGPLITSACHCRGCQKMTSSAFALSSLYSAQSFAVISGNSVFGGIKGNTQHHFCPECLSWVYTIPEGLDHLVNIRSSLLDDFAGHAPFAEFYLDEGLPGMSAGAERSFAMAPEPEDFPELLREFSERNDDNSGNGAK